MTAPHLIAIALLVPVGLLPAVLVAGRRLGPRVAWLALAGPVTAFLAVAALVARHDGQAMVVEWTWIPSLGLSLSFLVDGLSLFYGLIVSGMGVLIFFYSGHYLDGRYRHHGRFYAYLLVFMAAMLGTVFSNNLLLLFVFWELTGITSFLLIGFSHDGENSRRGARMALLITGGTGLLLMAGVVLVNQVAGTLDLRALLARPPGEAPAGPLWNVAFLCVALGAFGKSAQFPFHFWLPNAMAAPTPVSAYLHSATMVKLGVFLVGRTLPIFGDAAWWLPVLVSVGAVTMVLGAVLALLAHDLKAILANSTVSYLGLLMLYYGLGRPGAVDADYLHIASHVLFKGSLFMAAGIIDHATGTRDLRQLGGLGRRAPLLAVAVALAAASMAGLPPTLGFISKEMLLKTAASAGPLAGWVVAAVAVAAALKVAFSLRLFAGAFLGRETEQVKEHFHAPGLAFVTPPLLLAGLALGLGIFPGPLEGLFQHLRSAGLHAPQVIHLALWHGFTRELALSGGIVAAGVALYWLGQRSAWRWAAVPAGLRWDAAFDAGVDWFGKFTKTVTDATGADSPPRFLAFTLSAFVALVLGTLVLTVRLETVAALVADGLADHRWNGLRALVAGLIALAALGVARFKEWPAQVVSLGVSGFLVCFYFVLYRAPDLALTQILVDTVALVLIVYLLSRFARAAQQGEARDRAPGVSRPARLAVSVGVGVMMTALGLLVTARPGARPIGPWFLETTVPLAEGANAVNTILVDYRGFDTLGEVTVLVIAALGCVGLFLREKRTPAQFREGPLGPPGRSLHRTAKEDAR
ncbi:MAG: hydrogen gas-evolving membrane-bound hydrogenase subunit E [Limisphaerales bacterium]